ncbi:COQ9 family protein [Frigidibacter sp. ROC022]|uniref:COQ9 family protein n=1 Tax=Frigidibacter sp. ROC022 TaxID=2971796 RepID=UPI00215AD103|nr:COQ9 family protein [Frigidibacter sp. ROC022]MCR8724270.1 COQ9 family protein [Frigidibacter sp. ROC022]
MTDSDTFLDAVLRQVPFEGFSQAAIDAAAAELGLSREQARALAPRGPVGLAAAYHKRGDAQMLDRLAKADLSDLKFRERIALAVRLRLEDADRELVRRGTTLFALPQHAVEGARLIWGTADAIWSALGDTSEDVNWYSKRLTLSGVISATVLYWLGDASEGAADSWAFLDRRIEDVMRIETAKARMREVPGLARLFDSPLNPLNKLHKPAKAPEGYPGKWQR